MNKVRVWAISPRALSLLLENAAEDTTIPAHWFNWTVGVAGNGLTTRLSLMPKDRGAATWLVSWYGYAHRDGYAPGIVLTEEDDLQIPKDLDDLSIATMSIGDRAEIEAAQRELSEPDDYFIRDWGSIRRGAGLTFSGPEAAPELWRAYGDELSRWFSLPASRETLAGRIADYASWEGCAQLSPADFVWPESGTSMQTRAMFVSLRLMPCCGVALDARGATTVGMLTTGWEWDNKGLIKRKLLQYLDSVAAGAAATAGEERGNSDSLRPPTTIGALISEARMSLSLQLAQLVAQPGPALVLGSQSSENLTWQEVVRLPGEREMVLAMRVTKRHESAPGSGSGAVHKIAVENPEALDEGIVQAAIEIRHKDGSLELTKPILLSRDKPSGRIYLSRTAPAQLVIRKFPS